MSGPATDTLNAAAMSGSNGAAPEKRPEECVNAWDVLNTADAQPLDKRGNFTQTCWERIADEHPSEWDRLWDAVYRVFKVRKATALSAVKDVLARRQAAADADKGGIEAMLAPLQPLNLKSSAGDFQTALTAFATNVRDASGLARAIAVSRAVELLEGRCIDDAHTLVSAALEDAGSGGDHPALKTLKDPEPWPEPVDGAALADEIVTVNAKYAVLPEHAAEAIALWDLFTWVIDGFDLAPILRIISPVKRCGKSTVKIVNLPLQRRALAVANISVASIYHSIEAWAPTLVLDEADTFLKKKGNEEVVGILNSGHTRTGAYVVRMQKVEDGRQRPQLFSTFNARFIISIGQVLEDTTEDRSIAITMHRRRRGVAVAKLRQDRIGAELEPLRQQAFRWAQDNVEGLRAAEPDVPAALDDRAADNWRPLLAIADLLGGAWPQRARDAALALSGGETRPEEERGIQLLADLRGLLAEHGKLSSEVVVKSLATLPERAWATYYHDKPITEEQLARLLRPYGIKPRQLWIAKSNRRGYDREDFKDTWQRYLPPLRQPVPASDPLGRLGAQNDKDLSRDSDPLDNRGPSGSVPPVTPRKDAALTDLAGRGHVSAAAWRHPAVGGQS